MSITVQFHPETHVVCLRPSGELSLSAAQATLTALFKNPEFRPGMALVWDLRRGGLGPFTGESIRAAVEFIAERLAVRGRGNAALVVSQPVNYGIGRMFEALTEQLPVEFRVFWDFDEAMGWAGGLSCEEVTPHHRLKPHPPPFPVRPSWPQRRAPLAADSRSLSRTEGGPPHLRSRKGPTLHQFSD